MEQNEYDFVPTLDPNARNYRLGWSTTVATTPSGHWTIAEAATPLTGCLGMRGILREYYALRSRFETTYYSVALWQGDRIIARGMDLRYAITEYEAERESARWRKAGR